MSEMLGRSGQTEIFQCSHCSVGPCLGQRERERENRLRVTYTERIKFPYLPFILDISGVERRYLITVKSGYFTTLLKTSFIHRCEMWKARKWSLSKTYFIKSVKHGSWTLQTIPNEWVRKYKAVNAVDLYHHMLSILGFVFAAAQVDGICMRTARSALKTMVWIAQGQFSTVCIIIHLGARGQT